MSYNPESRVWRGKSYRKGGETGKKRGITIREDRDRDLLKVEKKIEQAD